MNNEIKSTLEDQLNYKFNRSFDATKKINKEVIIIAGIIVDKSELPEALGNQLQVYMKNEIGFNQLYVY